MFLGYKIRHNLQNAQKLGQKRIKKSQNRSHTTQIATATPVFKPSQAAHTARSACGRSHLASEVMMPAARVVVRMVPGVIEPGSVMAWEPTRVML